jgi:hypothetical protein
MDDVAAVLTLLSRYAAAQETLEHQTSIQRERAVLLVSDLLAQAHALYEVVASDPQRWDQAQEDGVAAALESLNTSFVEMSLQDIRAHGVTWRGDV